MKRGQRAKSARTKLAGFGKLQVAGNQHGMHVLKVHFASIGLEAAESIVGRQRAFSLEQDIRTVDLIPTRLEHGSGKYDAIGAVIMHP
jgi:hypothetical protein